METSGVPVVERSFVRGFMHLVLVLLCVAQHIASGINVSLRGTRLSCYICDEIPASYRHFNGNLTEIRKAIPMRQRNCERTTQCMHATLVGNWKTVFPFAVAERLTGIDL
jgi:hypothetical protein